MNAAVRALLRLLPKGTKTVAKCLQPSVAIQAEPADKWNHCQNRRAIGGPDKLSIFNALAVLGTREAKGSPEVLIVRAADADYELGITSVDPRAQYGEAVASAPVQVCRPIWQASQHPALFGEQVIVNFPKIDREKIYLEVVGVSVKREWDLVGYSLVDADR
jgi:hypothetical protein